MIRLSAQKAASAALSQLQAARLHWVLGVRFAVACGVPAIIGISMGRPLVGVVAAIGALFPMLADIGGNLRERLTLMLATSACMTAGAAIGATTAGDFWLSLLLVAVAAFAAAWVSDLHRVLELVSRFAAVSVVIGAGAGVHDPRAAVSFFAGGVFACLLVLVGNLIRRAQDLQPLPTWSEGLRLVLSGRSVAGLRFTLCYTAVAVIAATATQAVGVQRGFWVTITALLVMRPDGPKSLELTVQRFIGTTGGIALAALVVLFGHQAWVLIGWALLLAFFAPIGLKGNYALGVGLVTAFVMVLLDLALLHQGGDRPLLWVRLVDTGLGCVLALCGTAIAYPGALRKRSPAPGQPGPS
ncbi:MAG TPA: FUSC family protein [Burkholderiales bacterium]|nr:FUSC family protein [Burkholderiales bacterium]